MEENILEVEGLVEVFDQFQLHNVSFHIPKGYIMGFVGQNGSGKTTTIKCIMDLIRFDSGSIRLFGEDHRKDPAHIRNRIGYVSEDSYFYEDMSVDWTGQFVGRFYDRWDEQLFKQLLKRFEVNPSKKVKELSCGMKVKCSLALAMAHHPELMILEKHKLLDDMTVIKADTRLRHPELDKLMIGLKEGEYGYSAVVRDIAVFRRKWSEHFPDADYKTERLNLDELLLRIVKEEGSLCLR